MKINKLSIIVPAYNEEKTIARVISKLNNLKLGEVEKEIIVVDDGSTDRSKEILKGFPFCNVFSHRENRGKGAAIKTGLRFASGDYTIIQDADLEYQPKDIKKLVNFAEQNQALVVYGSRFLLKAVKTPSDIYKGGLLLALFTNALYGTSLNDEATGYKLLNTNLLRNLNLTSNGFEFCPEVTAKIANRGIKIHEVPIKYKPRNKKEGKKLKFFPDAAIAIWVLLTQRFKNEEKGAFNLFDKVIRNLRINKILSYLPKKHNLSLCDIGCGQDAYLLHKLQSKIKIGVGIDSSVGYSPEANISFIEKKIIKKIPLFSERFDVVILSALLEHLDYPEIVLKETWRILKKGGLLIMTTPSPRAKIVLETLSRFGIISRKEIKDHKRYFSHEELVKILLKIGFQKNNITLQNFEFGLNTIVVAKKK